MNQLFDNQNIGVIGQRANAVRLHRLKTDNLQAFGLQNLIHRFDFGLAV